MAGGENAGNKTSRGDHRDTVQSVKCGEQSHIAIAHLFSAQLAGVSDEVRVSIRTAPNLLPPCEQPLLSMSNNSRLWGNVNVLARCGNDKRYLQVNVQATGNYVVAAMPIVREENWKLAMSN